MTAIIRKELRTSFSTLFGWGISAILLFFSGLFVALFNLLSGYADIAYALAAMPWVLIFVLPFLTAHVMTSDKRAGTEPWLASLPISPCKRICGKLAAALLLFWSSALPTLPVPILLTSFGTVSLAACYSALLGYLLLGTAIIALCGFFSVLIRRTPLAILLSIAALLALQLLDVLAALLPASPLTAILLTLDLFNQYSGFTFGHMDLPALLLYLCITVTFALATLLITRLRMAKNTEKRARMRICAPAALSVCISLALNITAACLPMTVMNPDLTGTDTFRISGAAKDHLSTLSEDVTLTLLCQGGAASADGDIYAFLSGLADASPHIQLKAASPAQAADRLSAMGIAEAANMSILVESDRRAMLISNTELYHYLYATSSGSMSMTPDEYSYMLSYLAASDETGSYLSQFVASVSAQFDGEASLIGAIGYVTLEHAAVACIYTGSNASPLDSALTRTLKRGNTDLREVSAITALPDDCSVLIINAPATDLSASEAEALSSYLADGGRLFLTTAAGSTAAYLPKLSAVLALYGLQMPDTSHQVCETDGNYLPSADTPSSFRPHVYSQHPATPSDFSGIGLLQAAHAIDTVPTEGVTLTEWLYTSDDGYRTDAQSNKLGEAGRQVCGVIAETEKSAIVWIASSYALTDTSASEGGNSALFLSSLDHLSGADRADTPSLASRTVKSSFLTASQGAVTLWTIVLAVLIPLAVICTGCAVRYIRKKR